MVKASETNVARWVGLEPTEFVPVEDTEANHFVPVGGTQSQTFRPLAPNLHPLDFDRVAANFAKHVDRSGGKNACWPWTGTKQSKGYGCLGYRCADGIDRRFLAHRVALMLATAQHMVLDMQVMHSCDNPPCCNPRHLFVGSHSDNMQDAVRKGRMAIGAKNPQWKGGKYATEAIRQKRRLGRARARARREVQA